MSELLERPGEAVRPESVYAFAPDPDRARFLDRRVRERLADSLDGIFESLGDDLGVRPAAAAGLAADIRRRRARPAVFGLYADLVTAIFADDLAGARALAAQLVDEPRAAGDLRQVTTDDAALGAGQAERLRRMIDEESQGFAMAPLPPDGLDRSRRLLEESFALLDAAAPELAGELRGLIAELVWVDGTPEPGGLIFDGATTFYLWGAVVLNAMRQHDRLGLAQALAHEGAHAHLLGVSVGQKLVENDDEARYVSPLRHDLRPMDGIAHAVYVEARVVWCLQRLIGSGALDAAEVQAAKAAIAHNRQCWRDGLETLDAHGRLTPDGERLFAEARRFMAAAS